METTPNIISAMAMKAQKLSLNDRTAKGITMHKPHPQGQVKIVQNTALDPSVNGVITKLERWAMHRGVGLVVLLIMNLLLTGTAFSKSTTWNRTTGGSWTTSSYWTNGVPATGDDVIINSDQSGAITSVPAITLNSLTINGDCLFNGSPSGALVTVTGSFTLGSGNTLTTGNTSGSINFELDATATGNIAGTFTQYEYSSSYNRYFYCYGDLTITSTGVINGSADFILYSGATLHIANTAGITISGSSGAIQTGSRTYNSGGNYEYNGTAAQVTGNGLTQNTPANLTISNGAGVALSATTVISGSLTINSGAVLNTNNNSLTLSGNLTNDGAFNAGSSTIVFSGTSAQSIDGFTTAGTVISTKTGNTATFQGNVNGGGLTINGSGGTLNLGSGLTHTFTGNLTRTTGTLNGGSSLLRIGGNSSGNSTFTANTGTVEWNAAGPQTIAAVAYNNLILSGSGAKTIATGTSVTGNLSISGATASINNGLNISVGSLTLGGVNRASGTWGSTSSPATHQDDTYFAATTGYLTVSADLRPVAAFSGLTASQATCFGTTSVTLSGIVSAAGPIYASDGETVGITINGATQNAVIAGGAGGFSVSFNTSAIPANSTAYTITYAYTGGTNLAPAADNTSTTLKVNENPKALVTGQSNIKCFAGNDGSITISASGGTLPESYSYSVNNGGTWKTGANPYIYGELSAGVPYQIRVMDNNTECKSIEIPNP